MPPMQQGFLTPGPHFGMMGAPMQPMRPMLAAPLPKPVRACLGSSVLHLRCCLWGGHIDIRPASWSAEAVLMF